ncbi:MAG: hypothetical protein QOK41_1363, partial [Sphingomonadales bacterium]|nr:hypothetical protein [Sphingomonadales bacterium]
NSEVGNVTGVRGPTPGGNVDVLKGTTINNTKTGDITGVESVPRPKT